MRYITERDLRDQFAAGVPDRYDLPAGCALTPAARQYLLDLKLYRHPAAPARGASSPRPRGPKPEHMTSLTSGHMVCKTHPHILLRGRLDTLESEILVQQAACGPEWSAPLRDALLLVRAVMAAEVRDIPMPSWTLDGMSPEEVHRCSHHPEEFGFPGHILPAPEHGMVSLQMNRLRALTRETELAAVQTFWNGQQLEHEDCVLALNRLSSYFYILQLRAARR